MRPPFNMHPLQDEEKQQFAAASLQYNLQHTQLKAMFQKELQAATAGSSTTADESSGSSCKQPPADSTAQAGDQSQSSQPMRKHQSDFLDRMYQLMMEGQPQYALAQMEDELK